MNKKTDKKKETAKKKYIKNALEMIKKHGLTKSSHVWAFIEISQTTYYDTYGLHRERIIVDAIEKNKVSMKSGLRLKWLKSDDARRETTLYKLLADGDELERLKSNPEIHINTEKKEVPKRIIYKIKKKR